jgi:tetrahydromethanopterin S-methyltransferase subunit A
MNDRNEFKKINFPAGDKLPSGVNHRHRNLIKREQVVNHDPVVIKINEDDVPESGPSTIQPIIEDGIVIGIFFRCSCGRTEEIKFIYEK